MGEAMIRCILENMDRELMLQALAKKVQPYGLQYTLELAYSVGLYHIQTYD